MAIPVTNFFAEETSSYPGKEVYEKFIVRQLKGGISFDEFLDLKSEICSLGLQTGKPLEEVIGILEKEEKRIAISSMLVHF